MSAITLAKYYTDLLIIQYRDKAKARATITALALQALADDIYTSVRDAFDLDDAVGDQLDMLGKYIGITRNVFDFSGPVTLNDADYQILLGIKIQLNMMDSSLKTIDDLLFEHFPDELSVFDQKNMSLGYFYRVAYGVNQLAEIFTRMLLPKPMAVGLGVTVFSPGDLPFFGFRSYSAVAVNSSPFNTYADFELDRPWLSSAYAITF